jgi:6-pyruvoyl-tetrahydropterin synthase related domain
MVLPWLWRGIPSGHDFEFHMNSWMEVAAHWANHVLLPRWAVQAHYGYGEPRFIFYPPFSWMLGALFGTLLPWKLAPAAYVISVLTLSGCSMFLLARECLRANQSLFAAVFYALNPYHIVIVYWRSAFAELLAGALLPLLLLFILRMERTPRRSVVPLTAVIACGWLSNAPAAVMINYSAAVLIAVVGFRQRSLRPVLIGGCAILLGAALAAFYVLPAAYEQKWIEIAQVLSPGVRPEDNFLFTTVADADHNRFNLLASCVGIAEIVTVVLLALKRRPRASTSYDSLLLTWIGLATLLMLSVTMPFYRHFPELRFVQLPWRWLLCLNVPLALLLPATLQRWPARATICAVLLAVIAVVWIRVQPPWWDRAADITEMQQLQRGAGYEGTDEYAPKGADPYDVDRSARKLTYEGSGTAALRVVRWDPEDRFVTADVSAPGNLVMKLFNYPAWKVEVNGRGVESQTRDDAGQMIVPVPAGRNYVEITFTRTWDRTAGAWISLLSLVGLGLMGIRSCHAS